MARSLQLAAPRGRDIYIHIYIYIYIYSYIYPIHAPLTAANTVECTSGSSGFTLTLVRLVFRFIFRI